MHRIQYLLPVIQNALKYHLLMCSSCMKLEMDVDTTQSTIYFPALFRQIIFPSTGGNKADNNKKEDPTPFFRSILTNIGKLQHNVRQRVFLDELPATNLDLAVIMVQDYQGHGSNKKGLLNIMDPKHDWVEIIEKTLYSFLRNKALPSFKAIAIAAQWNVDNAIFHQISKKEWSEEKVTFFHEVVSGRFSLTSEGINCTWGMYSPHDVEKTVLPIIKFLVTEIGADVNGSTSDCQVKPLFEAVRAAAPLSVIKLLLELGADINGRNWKGGRTALHACCAQPCIWQGETRIPETVELLLQAGADQDCQDDNGVSPKDILTRPKPVSHFGTSFDSQQPMRDRILAMMARYSATFNQREGNTT